MPPSNTSPLDPKQVLENRRLLLRCLLDIIILISLVIPIIVCEFVIEPNHRGFFCDDETIRYPFKENTITSVMLGFIVALPSLMCLVVGEYLRQHNKVQLAKTRRVFSYDIKCWHINCLQQIIYFAFGLLLTFDATEVGKYTVGRLRPHFMAVCQPQLMDGSTCYDAVNKHRYVENYFCLATGFATSDVRQIRLSFPSGHSSLAFYAMIYVSLYLQKRMSWRKSNLTKPCLQFVLIMLAWFTALSRIMDYWHHWSDVLAGSIIGAMGALITANYISQFFKTSYTDFGSLRLTGLTRQDTSATLNEVLAATPPPYTINQAQAEAFKNETFCTKV